MRIIVCYFMGFVCMNFLQSCDSKRVFEENKSIENDNWHYEYKPFFDVYLQDTLKSYHVYVNLRISSDYKYNNIFLWLHTTNPNNQVEKRRIEIRLADENGKWKGSGLGDIFDYQFPVYQNIKLTTPGIYHFEVEQNMRDDILKHIKSTGIRIEYTD